MLLENKNAVIYGAGGAIGGAVARHMVEQHAGVILTITAGPREATSNINVTCGSVVDQLACADAGLRGPPDAGPAHLGDRGTHAYTN